MSSITVISTPAEIYYYGTMFLWFLLSYILVSFIVNYLYMPFFYRQGEFFCRRITVPTRNALYHKTMSEKQPKPVIKKFNCSFYYTSLNQDNSGYTSTYQYIEDRFGRSFKLLLCVIYTFNTIVYAGIGMFN